MKQTYVQSDLHTPEWQAAYYSGVHGDAAMLILVMITIAMTMVVLAWMNTI